MTSTLPFSLELQQRLFSYWQLSQYPQASMQLLVYWEQHSIHTLMFNTCWQIHVFFITTSFGGLLNHYICYYSMLTSMKHVLYIFFAIKIGPYNS